MYYIEQVGFMCINFKQVQKLENRGDIREVKGQHEQVSFEFIGICLFMNLEHWGVVSCSSLEWTVQLGWYRQYSGGPRGIG